MKKDDIEMADRQISKEETANEIAEMIELLDKENERNRRRKSEIIIEKSIWKWIKIRFREIIDDGLFPSFNSRSK